MDREKSLEGKLSSNLYKQIINLHNDLDKEFLLQYNRSLPFNEELFDRWKRAKDLGFGEKSSIYDSSLVFGNVQVGSNCWIGPFTIIDGSGGLEIGDYCTVSVGVQIYSHDSVKQTLSSGRDPIERLKVKIGNNVYIGPNAIIVKGIKIGNNCIIGACSYVKDNIPDNSIVFGQPAKIKGMVSNENDEVVLSYFK